MPVPLTRICVSRLRDEEDDPPKDELGCYLEVDELSDEPSQEEETLYGTSPPCTPRQMKRMSGKHHRSQGRAGGRSPNKGETAAKSSLLFPTHHSPTHFLSAT